MLDKKNFSYIISALIILNCISVDIKALSKKQEAIITALKGSVILGCTTVGFITTALLIQGCGNNPFKKDSLIPLLFGTCTGGAIGGLIAYALPSAPASWRLQDIEMQIAMLKKSPFAAEEFSDVSACKDAIIGTYTYEKHPFSAAFYDLQQKEHMIQTMLSDINDITHNVFWQGNYIQKHLKNIVNTLNAHKDTIRKNALFIRNNFHDHIEKNLIQSYVLNCF